jgi:hypothetical protein
MKKNHRIKYAFCARPVVHKDKHILDHMQWTQCGVSSLWSKWLEYQLSIALAPMFMEKSNKSSHYMSSILLDNRGRGCSRRWDFACFSFFTFLQQLFFSKLLQHHQWYPRPLHGATTYTQLKQPSITSKGHKQGASRRQACRRWEESHHQCSLYTNKNKPWWQQAWHGETASIWHFSNFLSNT